MLSLRKWKLGTSLLYFAMGAFFLNETSPIMAQENLKAVLQARYSAMKAAMSAHDGPAIGALLAPDFKSVEISGASKTKTQMIAEVNGLKSDPDKISETTLVSVSPVANQVTVDQRYEMKTVRTGKDGVAHPVKLAVTSTDTWIKSGSVWLLEETVTKEMSFFMGDRLIFHKVKP